MSSNVGVLNLDGQPVDFDILRTMAEAASYRGPNGISYHIVGDIGLAYLASNAIPESLSKHQPVSNRDGTRWIVADARVDNRTDLVRILADRAHIENVTEAELILVTYDVWGTECPRYIVGDFAFVIWDSKEKRLFCARDPMGARPFYYHFAPGRCFLWASECRQLFPHPCVSQGLDEKTVGAHLLPRPGQLNRSFFVDIAQLPPAHALWVDGSGLHVERYWDIDSGHEIRYRNDAEYEEHFLSIFQETVACRLRSTGSAGILLSAGLDSSAVACVAGDLIRRDSAPDIHSPVRTFTWVLEKSEKHREEPRYTDLIAEAYNMPREHIPADDYWLFSDYDTPSRIVPDDPTMLICPAILHTTLERARKLGVTTMITGGGGDALAYSAMPNYVDLLRGFQWRTLWHDLDQHRRSVSLPWPRFLWRHAISPELYLRRALARSQKMVGPEWIAPTFAQRVGLAEIQQTSLPWKSFRERSKLWGYQTATTACWYAVAEARLYNEHGLDYRLPWRDVRLFEFFMAIPSDQVWRAGETKHVVRRAMRGIIPETVRTLPSVPSIAPQITSGLGDRGRSIVEALLENPLLGRHGYVDAAALREAYRGYCDGSRASASALNHAIHLEIWLRRRSRDNL